MTNLVIKAVIFDCDGTLIDSEEAHLSAWRSTLMSRGHGADWKPSISITGIADTTVAALVGGPVEELLAEKNAHFALSAKRGLPSIEPTVDFVRRLHIEKERLGLKMGVASAAIKSDIMHHLRHLGIVDLFDIILSGHEDLSDYFDPEGVNKPKPYIYLEAARRLKVSPLECVVIEDSETGVASGQAAGCITIAIPNQHTVRHDLSAATLKIETLSGMSVDQFLSRCSRFFGV